MLPSSLRETAIHSVTEACHCALQVPKTFGANSSRLTTGGNLLLASSLRGTAIHSVTEACHCTLQALKTFEANSNRLSTEGNVLLPSSLTETVSHSVTEACHCALQVLQALKALVTNGNCLSTVTRSASEAYHCTLQDLQTEMKGNCSLNAGSRVPSSATGLLMVARTGHHPDLPNISVEMELKGKLLSKRYIVMILNTGTANLLSTKEAGHPNFNIPPKKDAKAGP